MRRSTARTSSRAPGWPGWRSAASGLPATPRAAAGRCPRAGEPPAAVRRGARGGRRARARGERRPALLRLRHRRHAARRARRRLADLGLGPERRRCTSMSPAAAAAEQTVDRSGAASCSACPPAPRASACVTGAQMANVTALAAARNGCCARAGWDVEAQGLAGAPPRARDRAAPRRTPRSSTRCGCSASGATRRSGVPADEQGRMRAAALAEALARGDGPTIVCAQAGNVNTGAFDPFERDRRRAAAPTARGATSTARSGSGPPRRPAART